MPTWDTNTQPDLPYKPIDESEFGINLTQQMTDLEAEFETVKESVSSGFKPLFTTDTTTAPTENVTYQAAEAGTYANLKDAAGDAAPSIVVSAEDFANPFVFLVYNAATDSWTKNIKEYEDEFEIIVGKNKYNKDTNSLTSYLVNDGTIGVSANYQVSDFIPVLPNTRYRKGYMATVARSVAFYDANKVFISFVAAGATQAGMPTASDLLTPADCAYIRMEVTNADAAVAQLEQGTTTTDYEAYTTTKELPAEKVFGLDEEIANSPALSVYAKTDDIITTGKNLFDKSKAIDGFYPSGTTGNLVANATLSATDYMPVTPNAAYYDPVLSQRAYYDINKVFVSGVLGAGGGGTFTVPNNPAIAYVRTTLQTSVKNTYQFELGTIPTSYADYQLRIKAELLPNDNQYWLQKDREPRRNLHSELKTATKPLLDKLRQTDVVSYKPIVLVCWGDSLMAYISTSSPGTIDKTKTFPCATSNNNLFSTIWKQLVRYLPDYRRWDFAGGFTEIGTWASYTGRTVNAAWDDNQDREADTRYSTTASASVGFNIPADYRMCNFIDRTVTDGRNVTVTVTQGGGYMQVLQNNDWIANVWVEANGYSFSQAQVANAGNAIGNTEYQRRIYFRKTAGHLTDSVDMVFTADATTNNFCYYGIELVKRNNYLQIYNAARGQHTTTQILPYMQTDIWNKNPDFIFWEVPMANNLNVPTFAYTLQGLQDAIKGDRSGSTNTWNILNKTGNLSNCQVVAYMPSFRQSYYNSDGTYKIATSPYTYRDICDRATDYIQDAGIPVVDMELVYQEEVIANPDFDNIYNAMAGTSITGKSYTNDGTHLNDNAVKVWNQHTYIFD